MNNYWDGIYWEKHIKEDDLDNIEDNWILDYMKYLPKTGNLLDLGCGVGQYSIYFYNLGYNVSSCDISSKALEILNEKNKNIKMKIQDMNKPLDYKDNEFDIVFANLSIHFLSDENTKSLLGEIKRILKPNGIFIGSVNSTKAYEFIKDHIIKLEDNYYDSNGRTVRLLMKSHLKNISLILIKLLLLKRKAIDLVNKKINGNLFIK
ncbi:class I SAM-dependent methyltransferase [bacterium]|nr:class I SAM-dependent methyltransferase [bacterium]